MLGFNSNSPKLRNSLKQLEKPDLQIAKSKLRNLPKDSQEQINFNPMDRKKLIKPTLALIEENEKADSFEDAYQPSYSSKQSLTNSVSDDDDLTNSEKSASMPNMKITSKKGSHIGSSKNLTVIGRVQIPEIHTIDNMGKFSPSGEI